MTAGNLPGAAVFPPGPANPIVTSSHEAKSGCGSGSSGSPVKLGATTTASHLIVAKPLFYSAVDDVRIARPLDLSPDEESDGHAGIMLTVPPVEH